MKNKIPPFHIYNKLFHCIGHTIPYDMIHCAAIKGPLNIELLKDSIRDVILDTPLLQTRIKYFFGYARRKRLTQKKLDISSLVTTIETENDPGSVQGSIDTRVIEFINTPIQVSKQNPIRFMIAKKTESESAVYMILNHTVTDGEGAIILLSKIFQQYNKKSGVYNSINLPAAPKNYSIKPLEKFYDARNEAVNPLDFKFADFFKDSNNTTGTIKIIPILFKIDDFKKIKTLSKTSKYTINDIIAAIIAHAIYKVLKQRKPDADLFRLEQLTNFRKLLGIKGGLSNFVSQFNIVMNEDNFSSRLKILEAIHNKTIAELDSKKYIKNILNVLKSKFIKTSILTQSIKESDEKNSIKNNSYFTTTISNVGKVDAILEHPHSCQIQYLWAAVQPHQNLGHKWIVHTLGDNLIANLIYLDPIISPETAIEIADAVKGEISNFTQKDMFS